MDRQTAITLPEQTYARLQSLSKSTGQPAAFHIRMAIEEFLDDWEDVQRAEAILARIQSGQEKTCSLAEAEKSLGLSD